MTRRARFLLGFTVLLLVIWVALGFGVAYYIVMPKPEEFADRDEIAGFPVEPVAFTSSDGVPVSGWLAKAAPDRAVIFCAGISADRRQGQSRAEFYLQELGFSVLLIDLRGTGKTGQGKITIGFEERRDLQAAARYLRERGYTHVAAHGISLGAATIAFSFQEDPGYAFVVLESCYDTLENAWRNRLAMFSVPHFITYPVRWGVEAFMGHRAGTVAPLRYIGKCSAPALFMAGDAEPELRTAETQALFDACAAPYKQLHFFKGGRHENFLRRYPDEFRSLLRDFVSKVSQDWPIATVADAA